MVTPGTPNLLPTRQRAFPTQPSNVSSSTRRFTELTTSSQTENKPRKNIHVIFVVVIAVIALTLFSYFLFYLYLPNRDFMNKKVDKCVIETANLACWRRSSSTIEQGRFTCWHFLVSHDNGTALVQHNYVYDFPKDLNGCQNQVRCGMEQWPCFIGRNPSRVRFRWRAFRIAHALYCVIAMTILLLFSLFALWWFVRDKQKSSNNINNDFVFPDAIERNSTSFAQQSVDSVPFSSRRRLPTWAKDRHNCTNVNNNHTCAAKGNDQCAQNHNNRERQAAKATGVLPSPRAACNARLRSPSQLRQVSLSPE